MSKRNKYWVLFFCLIGLSSEVFSEPPEKIRVATQKILQSLRVPHLEFSMDSPEDPFALQIKEGKLDLVGSVSLQILLGNCFSKDEMKAFKKFFMEKFLEEHPNCLIEILNEACVYQSPLSKAICSLKKGSCKRQKHGEITLQLRCLLPIGSVDLFAKEERTYK